MSLKARIERLEREASERGMIPDEPFTMLELAGALLTDVARRLASWRLHRLATDKPSFIIGHPATQAYIHSTLSLRPIEAANLAEIAKCAGCFGPHAERARAICADALAILPRRESDCDEGEIEPMWATWQEGAVRGSHLAEWIFGPVMLADDLDDEVT